MPFTVRYSFEAAQDIRAMRVFDQQIILDSVDRHLSTSPAAVSRTRIKKMIQPFGSQYRLQVGLFRVNYDVDEAEQTVNVLRVLFKGTGITPAEST